LPDEEYAFRACTPLDTAAEWLEHDGQFSLCDRGICSGRRKEETETRLQRIRFDSRLRLQLILRSRALRRANHVQSYLVGETRLGRHIVKLDAEAIRIVQKVVARGNSNLNPMFDAIVMEVFWPHYFTSARRGCIVDCGSSMLVKC
jgi:hypothetical protein